MNRNEAKELLPVITAFANGEDVECQTGNGNWIERDAPSFDPFFKWRIKQKPKTCERWCFVVFYESRPEFVTTWPSEKRAKEVLVHYMREYPAVTYSSIVRVEFVEEKT